MYRLQVEAGGPCLFEFYRSFFSQTPFGAFSLKPVSLHQAPAVGP